jgi:hypothetical protein
MISSKNLLAQKLNRPSRSDFPTEIQPFLIQSDTAREKHPELWDTPSVDEFANPTGVTYGDGLGGYDRSPEELMHDLSTIYEHTDDAALDEFTSLLEAQGGLPAEALPPRPLNLSMLDEFVELISVGDRSDYTVYLFEEYDYSTKTRAEAYREYTGSPIIYFELVFKRAHSTTFIFTPALRNEPYFFWFAKQSESLRNKTIDTSLRKHPLSELVNYDQQDVEDFLFNQPEHVLAARDLLMSSTTIESPSPSPNNWTVTQLARHETKSEFLQPRYEGTFVHKPTGIVLEIIPTDADPDAVSFEENSYGIDISREDTDQKAAPHEWELHGASDTIQSHVTEMYDDFLASRLFFSLMEVVDGMAEP